MTAIRGSAGLRPGPCARYPGGGLDFRPSRKPRAARFAPSAELAGRQSAAVCGRRGRIAVRRGQASDCRPVGPVPPKQEGLLDSQAVVRREIAKLQEGLGRRAEQVQLMRHLPVPVMLVQAQGHGHVLGMLHQRFERFEFLRGKAVEAVDPNLASAWKGPRGTLSPATPNNPPRLCISRQALARAGSK